jgi:hypothetical protein
MGRERDQVSGRSHTYCPARSERPETSQKRDQIKEIDFDAYLDMNLAIGGIEPLFRDHPQNDAGSVQVNLIPARSNLLEVSCPSINRMSEPVQPAESIIRLLRKRTHCNHVHRHKS